MALVAAMGAADEVSQQPSFEMPLPPTEASTDFSTNTTRQASPAMSPPSQDVARAQAALLKHTVFQRWVGQNSSHTVEVVWVYWL
jgi:hypothetical protein